MSFELVVAVAAGLAVIAKPCQLGWRFVRRMSRFLDVWEGVGDEPGIDERLRDVQKRTEQLENNGGRSVKDVVDRVDGQLREHLAECRVPRWRRP